MVEGAECKCHQCRADEKVDGLVDVVLQHELGDSIFHGGSRQVNLCQGKKSYLTYFVVCY